MDNDEVFGGTFVKEDGRGGAGAGGVGGEETSCLSKDNLKLIPCISLSPISAL
jgi:hypothetical protein